MKYFVGVFFEDERVDRLFDLTRVVLQPDFARKAHITLRGPYKHRKDINKSVLEKQMDPILLSKPSTFFNERQNTVFLRAEIAFISDFWRKPDYPDGTPHLTIYDGKDRSFAWQVLQVLRDFPWRFYVRPTKLRILSSKEPLETKYLKDFTNFNLALDEVSDRSYSMEAIRKMHTGQRIEILRRVCRNLHTLHSNSDEAVDSQLSFL
ncbi:hypothetical protein P1J78_24505 [Psychromarinibacter sp. C21-152]|uniref:2'-5' RNA ligase n=1 Tax=Psychromarinibacter sediminicola TaxID=3033385 RepID=A0AAE3TCP6_9RHOB|nr:hypothetical protein [Psychromarinibacter sediminicola]MDF0603880.1 hypothetical protein [Psychromarinibacter sediminicola]